MQELINTARLLVSPAGEYATRIVTDAASVRAAQALRFEVFNLELSEGLAESVASGLDADPFDEVCDHLVIEHLRAGEIVGTYRLQTGNMAAANRGYYCEQEFDFRPFEVARGQFVELGRACVHRAHRNLHVLGLLWKGIADYATERGARYLCGCSSLTSQDPGEGAAAYDELRRKHLVEPRWRTTPLPSHACPIDAPNAIAPIIPKLLSAYLSVGTKICGPPALDRQFKTIDFLTLLDLESLPKTVRRRFFG